MKVVLTGATGFLGREVLRALTLAENRRAVHVLSRSPRPDDAPCTWHQVDLFDAGAVRRTVTSVGPSHLIHLAWDTTPGIYKSIPTNAHWAVASLNLLRSFVSAGGRRAVMAGSCAEYDWTSEGTFKEDVTPIRPGNYYGECKNSTRVVSEGICAEAGIELVWGRIFLPYGPGERQGRLLPSIIPRLLARERAPCSSGLQQRDFIFRSDVAAAFVRLLDVDQVGPMNIGTGRATSVRDVVSLVAQMTDGADLIDWGALPAPSEEPNVMIADTTRLRSIGWEPKVKLEEGLSRTVDWWRRHEYH